MKTQEFRKLIREEAKKVLKEDGYGSGDTRSLEDIEKKLAELMDFSLSGYDRKVANEINILASIYKNKGGKKTLKAIAKENP
jgi:hypothetical protein